MATTIHDAFEELKSNLGITGLQETTVSTRQKNVRKALEDDFTILDSFLTGSYRRNTMIAPLADADIDIFVVLDPKYYSDAGQAALLADIRTALRRTYPKTPKISPNGQAVTIRFTDFKVDVVPGFYRKGGGYLIPDADLSRWIQTDPKKHVEIFSAANKEHDGDLVPLLKLLKAWNRNRNVLRSFHLDVLALSVLNDVKISNLWSGTRYFFDKSRDLIKVKLADPAGYSDDVAAHINTTEAMGNIVRRLTFAYNKAREAEKFAENDNIDAAFENWTLIFKGYFPTYG